MADINELIGLLTSMKQPQNELVNQALNASQRTNPPVYVVPDSRAGRVRYGDEVPNKTWQQNLGEVLGALRSYRAKKPVYMPFPAGTPTLAKQELAQQQAYQNAQLGLDAQRLALSTLEASQPSSSELKASAQGSAETGVWESLEKLKKLKNTNPESYQQKYGDRDPVKVVEEQINSQRGQLTSSGVDADVLIDYLYQAVYGMSKRDYMNTPGQGAAITLEK